MVEAGTTCPVALDSAPQKALWRYSGEIKAYTGITGHRGINFVVNAGMT